MLLINRLPKVANDPIVQGASLVNVTGVGSNEDRRNGVPDFNEVSVEFDSGHRRHMDVGDQASRFDETFTAVSISVSTKRAIARKSADDRTQTINELEGEDHGWLKAKHQFSFADCVGPARIGWGSQGHSR
jgi:hypothetical protein